MEWGIAAGIIVCILYVLDRIRKKRHNKAIEDLKNNYFNENNVNKIIVQFEHDLDQNIDLPDSIRRQQSYIYKHLMRKWYKEIIAKHRYNEVLSEKIRIDMIEYISNLEEFNRSRFLASESDENKRAKGEEDENLARLKVTAIEDGFAAACGPDAVKELEIIRNRAPWDFSEKGECIVSDNE